MASEFVRSAEALRAALKLAHMRFFASVGSDVARLMLQSVECFVTYWAFVWSRQVLALSVQIVLFLDGLLDGGRHQTDTICCHSGR